MIPQILVDLCRFSGIYSRVARLGLHTAILIRIYSRKTLTGISNRMLYDAGIEDPDVSGFTEYGVVIIIHVIANGNYKRR